MTTITLPKQLKDVSKDGEGQKDSLRPSQTLTTSTSTTSASAAFARSLFLFMSFMFRRPSKLFRPNRVDTWGALRQLAISADQNLSPSFLRDLVRRRTGVIALTITLLPPLVINTTLGFLLFTSHSFFSLSLARLPFFQRPHQPQSSSPENLMQTLDGVQPSDSATVSDEGEEEEEPINFHTLLTGPTIVPNHATLLSGIAGAGAGIVQGIAFTPVENVVRLLKDSAQSITTFTARFLHLPTLEGLPASDVTSPIHALRTFLSSDTWHKSPSWWTGWRWAVARDALSYGCFFAAFDVTRRVGLRVKGFFGGSVQRDWENFIIYSPQASNAARSPQSDFSISAPSSPDKTTKAPTPTIARVAQATTIVSGGIAASLLAEFIGRPFRACQKIMHNAHEITPEQAALKSSPAQFKQRPLVYTYRTRGMRAFVHPDDPPPSSTKPVERQLLTEPRLRRAIKRVGWRLAAVGPWGFGFLVWAWVGGEV